jgi:hypothetical protein
MNPTMLIAVNNQCAKVQAIIARKYENPSDSELIYELQELRRLLSLLLDTKT